MLITIPCISSTMGLLENTKRDLFCHSERSEESYKFNKLQTRDSSSKASEWHFRTA